MALTCSTLGRPHPDRSLPFRSFELIENFIARKELYLFCCQTERMLSGELLTALLDKGKATKCCNGRSRVGTAIWVCPVASQGICATQAWASSAEC